MGKKIKLSELEKRLILESVNNTPYQGIHSDVVSKVRKKMAPKPDGDDGETKLRPVADLMQRLPKRMDNPQANNSQEN